MAFLELGIDDKALHDLRSLMKQLADKRVELAMARAVKRVGDQAHGRIVKVLAKQVGTTPRAVKKYVIKEPPAPGRRIVYRIRAKSPTMSLKEFNPRAVAGGVSAGPWGKRRVFPRAFISASKGGHVFVRTGKKRLPVRKIWGPSVAKEMVKDQSLAEFQKAVAELPARLRHELEAILSGHVRG
jgi:hypothetical protein